MKRARLGGREPSGKSRLGGRFSYGIVLLAMLETALSTPALV